MAGRPLVVDRQNQVDVQILADLDPFEEIGIRPHHNAGTLIGQVSHFKLVQGPAFESDFHHGV
jgi:hypothetical protein